MSRRVQTFDWYGLCPGWHWAQPQWCTGHQDNWEEGTTEPIPPRETEKICHGSSDSPKVLQLHHREHPDRLHHCLVRQLLGLRNTLCSTMRWRAVLLPYQEAMQPVKMLLMVQLNNLLRISGPNPNYNRQSKMERKDVIGTVAKIPVSIFGLVV